MAIENDIARLGGLRPIEDQFQPLNQTELTEIEKTVAGKLPANYAWLLSAYGECLFVNSVVFKPEKQEPEYSNMQEFGIPNGADFFGSGVSTIYGKRQEGNSFTLLKKLRVFRDRMPEGFLPFADDGLGNQLCLCVHAANYQKVYWWDHELEWDAEDYEEETGTAMPVAAKYQNVYLVANSFTEFFEKLTISAQA